MVTIKLEFAPEVIAQFGPAPEQFTKELRLAAALHWWSQSRVSLGRAAQLAGVSYREFLDEIARRKLTWPADPDDYRREFELIEKMP